VRKGNAAAGDAETARGAGAMINAARAAYTMLPMSELEAKDYGIDESERLSFVRIDSAKHNFAKRDGKTQWVQLESVRLGNATGTYTEGDEVQAARSWQPPEMWDGFGTVERRSALQEIDEPQRLEPEMRYSLKKNSKDRWVGHALMAQGVQSEAAARGIVDAWIRSGALEERVWVNPTRRGETAQQRGVWVDWSNAPGQ